LFAQAIGIRLFKTPPARRANIPNATSSSTIGQAYILEQGYRLHKSIIFAGDLTTSPQTQIAQTEEGFMESIGEK
jgi:hypothetical protein